MADAPDKPDDAQQTRDRERHKLPKDKRIELARADARRRRVELGLPERADEREARPCPR